MLKWLHNQRCTWGWTTCNAATYGGDFSGYITRAILGTRRHGRLQLKEETWICYSGYIVRAGHWHVLLQLTEEAWRSYSGYMARVVLGTRRLVRLQLQKETWKCWLGCITMAVLGTKRRVEQLQLIITIETIVKCWLVAWNEETCRAAAANFRMYVLQWAIDQGCPEPIDYE